MQVFCFKAIEPPPPLLIEGLNFVRIWLFGLVQSSFVGLGISRMYLIYKVNNQYLRRMLSSNLHSFRVFQISMTVCVSNALIHHIHQLIWITFKSSNHFFAANRVPAIGPRERVHNGAQRHICADFLFGRTKLPLRLDFPGNFYRVCNSCDVLEVYLQIGFIFEMLT